MSRAPAVPVLALLLSLAGGLPAQTILPPGDWISGSLEASDPVDGEGFVYDAFRLSPDLQGLVRVSVESGDFDTYLEWGVMGGGQFLLVAENDDFAGLSRATDSRAYAPVGPGEQPEIRVFSLDGGPDGSYRVRADRVAQNESEPETVTYGADVVGELREGDSFFDGSFVDRFRFEGNAGDLVKIVLEADFDAYLWLTGPDGSLLEEDDDSYGETDAYLEVELPETGAFQVDVRAFTLEFGAYRLRLGPDLDAQPAPPPADVAITDEERNGLQYDDQRVWNDPLGFAFPSPGADFVLMDEEEVVAAMGEAGPNVQMWMFQDVLETAQLAVMAIKAPAALDSATVSTIGEMMVESTGGAVLEEVVDWEGARSVFTHFASGEEEAELFCRASAEDREGGLVVCLIGFSTDGWSFRETVQALEVR